MNIVNMVTSFATPMVANKIASALGLPEAGSRRVLTAAMPLLLGMLLKRGGAPGGPQALGAAIAGLGPNPLEALGRLFQGEPSKPALVAAAHGGGDLVSSLFGTGPTSTAAAKLAGYGGLDQTAAASLLGIAGTGVIGGLRQTADDQKLDADGLMRQLVAHKADVAKALPTEFARELQGAGLVDETLFTTSSAAPAPSAPPTRGGGTVALWIVGLLAVLALGGWLLSRYLVPPVKAPTEGEPPAATVPAPAPAPAAPTTIPATDPATPPAGSPAAPDAGVLAPVPPAPAPAPEPEPEPLSPGTTGQAAPPVAPANPLVVDGVDLGAKVQEVVGGLTGTLGAVSDAASAEQAVGRLREADITLEGLRGTVEGLPADGRAALRSTVGSALPTLRATTDRLLADPATGPVLRPVLGDIMAKLNAYAG